MSRTSRGIPPLTAAVLFLITAGGRGELMVNEDLGVLAPGAFLNLVANTADGANNADRYAETSAATANWGNEYVYQFQVTSASFIDLTLNSASGDPDFFLLGGLSTATQGGKNVALEDIDLLTLDDALPDTEFFIGVAAGTYYLSVDAFSGFDPPPATPESTMFDLNLSISAVEPPPVFDDLGAIAPANEPITVNSFGSDFDTLMGVFNNDGILLASNDDAGAVFQSEVEFPTGLPIGDYYVALSGFDTGFADGYLAVPFTPSEGGSYVLNYPGGVATGSLQPDDVQWFRFSVAVPEPSTWLLALAGIVPMITVGIARQAMTVVQLTPTPQRIAGKAA